jgi:hypothetical protein
VLLDSAHTHFYDQAALLLEITLLVEFARAPLRSPKSEQDMETLINLDFLQLVATAFLGVVGIVFTILQARTARRQNTVELYERWDTQELSDYRSVAWDVWMNLREGKDEAVICWLGGDYFGERIADINRHVPEERTHAVRSLLNYFTRVYEYQRLGLTDRRVTVELFREPWLWWGGFFALLQARVEAHLRAKDIPMSKWAACSFMTSLNRVSALDRVVRRK